MAYLSNSTMGDIWEAAWCANCVHDVDTCDVMLALLLGDEHDALEKVPVSPHALGWGPGNLICHKHEAR